MLSALNSDRIAHTEKLIQSSDKNDVATGLDLVKHSFHTLNGGVSDFTTFEARHKFVQQYGWAFLDEERLQKLADIIGQKKVLSIGSGSGFIEKTLSTIHDLDIRCTDIAFDGYGNKTQYTHVEQIAARDAVEKYSDCEVLFSSWPSYVTFRGENDYSDPSQCHNCNPVEPKKIDTKSILKGFKLKRCEKKPKGYSRMTPRAKKEFQVAQMKRQMHKHISSVVSEANAEFLRRQRETREHKKDIDYCRRNNCDYNDNSNLCICCAITQELDDDFAYEGLKNFKGDTFILVGEDRGGCTGSERMWCELQKNWENSDIIHHHNWRGIYSCVQIYKRK